MTLDILMVASVYCEWGTRSGCRVLPYARGATGSKKQIDTSGQLCTYQKMVGWKTVLILVMIQQQSRMGE